MPLSLPARQGTGRSGWVTIEAICGSRRASIWWPPGCGSSTTSAPRSRSCPTSRGGHGGRDHRVAVAVGDDDHACRPGRRPAARRTGPSPTAAPPPPSRPGPLQQQGRGDVGAVGEADRDQRALGDPVLGARPSCTNSASSSARRRRSSSSNTPSRSRRKNRGMPFSSTRAPDREHRGAGRQVVAQRQQVVLVAAGAVQQQQRGARGRRLRRAGRRAAGRGRSRRSTHGTSTSELQRRQRGRDLLAVGLQPRRQLEVPAELEQRLVDGEAGRVGGDLEQHAARARGSRST